MPIQLCVTFLREIAEQKMVLGYHYEGQGAPDHIVGRCFAEARNIYRIADWIEAPDLPTPELELIPHPPMSS